MYKERKWSILTNLCEPNKSINRRQSHIKSRNRYYFLHLLVHVMFCLVIFKIKIKSHLYWPECNNWLVFATLRNGRALKNHYFCWLLHQRMHKIVQYLSTLHTCETWFKHRRQEFSTSICDYNYDFLCPFFKKGENITHTNRSRMKANYLLIPSQKAVN